MKKKLDKRKKVIKATKAAQPKSKDPSAAPADSIPTNVSTVKEPTKPTETITATKAKVVDANKSTEDDGKTLDAEDEDSLEVKRAKRKAEKKAKREERRAREKELVERKTTQALSSIASKASSESVNRE